MPNSSCGPHHYISALSDFLLCSIWNKANFYSPFQVHIMYTLWWIISCEFLFLFNHSFVFSDETYSMGGPNVLLPCNSPGVHVEMEHTLVETHRKLITLYIFLYIFLFIR